METIKNVKLTGKTVIITGSNCGIGYETALGLAKRDATVIVACRDEKKAIEAVAKIKEASQNEKVEYELLDLSSLKSIKQCADKIKAKHKRIDILINNAGLALVPYSKTEDGFESMFGVNHLGHFYFTNLLLDLIKSSAPSRIVNVSSTAHKGVELDFNDLQSEKSFSSFNVYRKSKLANCLFTIELAKRLKDSNVTVASLHPGEIKTEINRPREGVTFGLGVLRAVFKPLIFLLGSTPEKGAQTSIYCAIADDVTKHSGGYYDDCKLSSSSKEARDEAAAEKLWNVSSKLVGL